MLIQLLAIPFQFIAFGFFLFGIHIRSLTNCWGNRLAPPPPHREALWKCLWFSPHFSARAWLTYTYFLHYVAAQWAPYKWQLHFNLTLRSRALSLQCQAH